MTRVVLDTNVVVSAMLSRRGNEARVVWLAQSGRLLPCVTNEILAEYDEVLHRPQFKVLDQNEVRGVLAGLGQGLMVRPAFSLAVSPDQPDNRFLECAQAANAEFLVTGNKRHFPTTWQDTRIVNARELLEAILFPE